MWKFIVRGIQSTIERRICRTNIYSQSSQDNPTNDVKTNLTSQQNLLSSTFTFCDKNFCEWAKRAGAKDKKYNSEWNARHSWPEAVSWSSILAAGWIVCQTLGLRKRIDEKDRRQNFKSKLYNCAKVPFIFSQIANLEPRNIFPVTVLAITNVNSVGNNNSNLQDSDLQWTSEKAFGPVTIEEAFEEAADEFSKTHKVVVGQYELCYGIKALKEKRHEDALMHFSMGAKQSSPGSMFNLGLCHELGIGTVVDQKKAAECYNDAAAHDHADALYNLGVFHAQGKGGLPVSIDLARICFIKAAKLGQTQAQQALDLEKAKTQSKKSNTSTVQNIKFTHTNLQKNKIDDACVKLSNYMLRENIADILNANLVEKSTRDTPEYNEQPIKDSTQKILNFLSLKEASQGILMLNDYSVPC
ncbi:uncharacterized protein [Linepithema humile]|uniref:uncharacterized protein n=1 Tax=Linepithema humile TaxID=83485 RepID=UPI00062361D3|nr:PREDICTED: uncharacterized protein LOC105674821 [Linepithema humile]